MPGLLSWTPLKKLLLFSDEGSITISTRARRVHPEFFVVVAGNLNGTCKIFELSGCWALKKKEKNWQIAFQKRGRRGKNEFGNDLGGSPGERERDSNFWGRREGREGRERSKSDQEGNGGCTQLPVQWISAIWKHGSPTWLTWSPRKVLVHTARYWPTADHGRHQTTTNTVVVPVHIKVLLYLPPPLPASLPPPPPSRHHSSKNLVTSSFRQKRERRRRRRRTIRPEINVWLEWLFGLPFGYRYRMCQQKMLYCKAFAGIHLRQNLRT